MTNVQFPSIDDYNDVAIKNLYRFETENGMSHDEIMRIIWKTGRDNSRTPMQWSREENGGFTDGTPWLKVNPNYSEINVEQAMEDPDSIYHHYKRLIRLRAENLAAVYGTYDLILADHPQIYAYTRTYGDEKLLVLCNLFPVEATAQLPEEYAFRPSELLLANYLTDAEENIAEIALKPYESRVYKLVGVQGSAGFAAGMKPPAAADGQSSITETV